MRAVRRQGDSLPLLYLETLACDLNIRLAVCDYHECIEWRGMLAKALTNVEGKDVLFSVKTGDSYGLNETAARMVRLALEMGLDGAVKQLAEEYGAPESELRGDLVDLLGELVQLKLAETSSDQAG